MAALNVLTIKLAQNVTQILFYKTVFVFLAKILLIAMCALATSVLNVHLATF